MPGADPTQDLFAEDLFPQGLKYQAGYVGPEEEEFLLRQIERLPFRKFEFRGFTGKLCRSAWVANNLREGLSGWSRSLEWAQRDQFLNGPYGYFAGVR